MASLFSRAFGGGDSLDADLKRVTESGVVEVPKDLLKAVAQATHNEDDRRQIMRHLRECLAEPSGKRWRRVYAGLLLVEELSKNASRELIVETAEGHHFDLVQRLSLLEHFECTSDRRVQNMVRSKATALRGEVMPQLQTVTDGPSVEAGRECASTCSPGAAPSSCSTASTSASAPWKPGGTMVLNGIVAVGHTDDTTSESSGEEVHHKAVEYREARKTRKGKAPAKGRQHRVASSSDGSDSDRGGRQRGRGGDARPAVAPTARQHTARAPTPPPVPTTDLLDL